MKKLHFIKLSFKTCFIALIMLLLAFALHASIPVKASNEVIGIFQTDCYITNVYPTSQCADKPAPNPGDTVFIYLLIVNDSPDTDTTNSSIQITYNDTQVDQIGTMTSYTGCLPSTFDALNNIPNGTFSPTSDVADNTAFVGNRRTEYTGITLPQNCFQRFMIPVTIGASPGGPVIIITQVTDPAFTVNPGGYNQSSDEAYMPLTNQKYDWYGIAVNGYTTIFNPDARFWAALSFNNLSQCNATVEAGKTFSCRFDISSSPGFSAPFNLPVGYLRVGFAARYNYADTFNSVPFVRDYYASSNCFIDNLSLPPALECNNIPSFTQAVGISNLRLLYSPLGYIGSKVAYQPIGTVNVTKNTTLNTPTCKNVTQGNANCNSVTSVPNDSIEYSYKVSTSGETQLTTVLTSNYNNWSSYNVGIDSSTCSSFAFGIDSSSMKVDGLNCSTTIKYSLTLSPILPCTVQASANMALSDPFSVSLSSTPATNIVNFPTLQTTNCASGCTLSNQYCGVIQLDQGLLKTKFISKSEYTTITSGATYGFNDFTPLTSFNLYFDGDIATNGTTTPIATSSAQNLSGNFYVVFSNASGSNFSSTITYTNFFKATNSVVLPVCEDILCTSPKSSLESLPILASGSIGYAGQSILGNTELTTSTNPTSLTDLSQTGVTNGTTFVSFSQNTGRGEYYKPVQLNLTIPGYTPVGTYVGTVVVTNVTL